MNLYEILNIPSSANLTDIKYAYKKLALKYHPDKCDNQHTTKFHAITTAYTILKDPIKKIQYDNLGYINKDDNLGSGSEIPNMRFSSVLNDLCSKLFFTSQTSLFTKKEELTFDDMVKNNNIEMATNYIINTLSQHFGTNFKEDSEEVNKYESDCASSESNIKSYDSMDIIINLNTTVEEVYQGKIKVVAIERQILEGTKMVLQSIKLNVPVCNDSTIFENEGNDYINDENKLTRSKVIVKMKCLYSKYYKRINEFDMMILTTLTDDEFENGYLKSLTYFEKTIKIKCKNPKEKMENNKIITKLVGHGIKYYKDSNFARPLYGDLIIACFKNKNNSN